MNRSDFEPVIGLEIHAQISTKSKMFCACKNDSFGARPNTNVCPICMGFPGMLPVFNREALEKGAVAALALHCALPPLSKFDRKNYFYPDLPKGFQISQYDQPVSKNGYVEVRMGKETKRIRVHRLHLEDDAGKLVHVGSGTLCDYNRSGCPLMEIVSEPDMTSVEEASEYAQEVRRILRYAGASDCDMEKGMMRFDINVSLRPRGEKKLGTKAEVKNLNSFRALERALAHEIERQAQVLASGGRIEQETRGWDDARGETFSQRSKEEAHDYRYFPEPDLPPIAISRDQVKTWTAQLGELPLARRQRFIQEFGLSEKDAGILTEEKAMADYFEEVVRISQDAPKAVSFITTILLKHLNEDGVAIGECKIRAGQLGALITLVKSGAVSNTMAKSEIFAAMYATGDDPQAVVERRGLKLVSDAGAIEAICRKVLEENPGPAEDFKKGKQQALGFLVGKAMQASKGQADPKTVNEILRKILLGETDGFPQ